MIRTRHKATFRFYAELNDFLPSERRQVSFDHYFKQNPAIKDAIEGLGVPHCEVDLIIVNGESKRFDYQLQPNDNVAVYPLFERLDISSVTHLRPKPLRVTRFILDVHLGKLARYLRLLGFDTLYQTSYTDSQIIQIAANENRIILTRDIGLLKNKRVTHGLWIRSTHSEKQLHETIQRLDLRNQIHPFIRCIHCNGKIVNIEKETIEEKLLPKTRLYFNKFSRCLECGKIYWPGSHYHHMQTFMTKLINWLSQSQQ